MEDQSNAGPPSKRQRIIIANDTSGITTPTASPQNKGVLAAVNKVTKLVEGHPQFNSKLERILEGLYNELEPEVSAATRKQKNEVSCPIYKLSNDELKHICGYVGEMQYGFVACTSYTRFHQVYLETFRNETCTSFRNASVSVSCAKLCLASTEGVDVNVRAKSLFNAAARYGQVHVLQEWGDDSGCDLNMCSSATENGHLEVLKWARARQCSWDEETCSATARNGHLEVLKWARENACLCYEKIFEDGRRNGNPALMHYLEYQDCPSR